MGAMLKSFVALRSTMDGGQIFWFLVIGFVALYVISTAIRSERESIRDLELLLLTWFAMIGGVSMAAVGAAPLFAVIVDTDLFKAHGPTGAGFLVGGVALFFAGRTHWTRQGAKLGPVARRSLGFAMLLWLYWGTLCVVSAVQLVVKGDGLALIPGFVAFCFGVFCTRALPLLAQASAVEPEPDSAPSRATPQPGPTTPELEEPLRPKPWRCPECDQLNTANVYKCESCGYDLV
ncbi:MAG: hypothetical protein KC609_12670 [Myxococcales bacterium]|nr:hypothetical protein [Myxococcales bacterium]